MQTYADLLIALVDSVAVESYLDLDACDTNPQQPDHAITLIDETRDISIVCQTRHCWHTKVKALPLWK